MALLELSGFLEGFLPDKASPLAIRRANLPKSPDYLPTLSDPSANDQIEIKPINQRFTSALPDYLIEGEQVYTWALLPAWFENRGYAQALIISEKRLFVVPDPLTGLKVSIEIPFSELATLEYVSSILRSYIGFNIIDTGNTQSIQISFPYTAAGAFQNCLTVIQRCLGVLPAWEKEMDERQKDVERE